MGRRPLIPPREDWTGERVSPVAAGLTRRCPRCGRGRLFSGLLKVADRCEVCGLDLAAMDAGDGPAVFLIFVLGTLITPLAIWLQMAYDTPLWLQIVLWPPILFVLAMALMPPSKALVVALTYKYRRDEFEGRSSNQQ